MRERCYETRNERPSPNDPHGPHRDGADGRRQPPIHNIGAPVLRRVLGLHDTFSGYDSERRHEKVRRLGREADGLEEAPLMPSDRVRRGQ